MLIENLEIVLTFKFHNQVSLSMSRNDLDFD